MMQSPLVRFMRFPVGVSSWLSPLVFFVAVIAFWEVYVHVSKTSTLILPPPTDIVRVGVNEASLYLEHSRITLMEITLGFLLAVVVGVALGVLIAVWQAAATAIYPLLVASQVVPKVAIAPLTIVWFGFGMTSKVVVTALIAFFPVVISTIVGLNMTTIDGIHLLKSMGASRVQAFVKLQLPLALPVIFSGVKVAATLAVVGAVVGEFAGGSEGLGFLILIQSGQLNSAAAFASIGYLTVIGMLVFGAVALVERLFIPAHMLRRITD